MSVILIILGLILFVGLVLAHEYGHFKLARKNGVDVEEFGLGFPPRIWSKKLKSGMLLSVNLLPIGGFVKLKGEHDADKGPGTFGSASLGAKAKIMLAGVAVNLLIALGILTIVSLMGMPQVIDNQFNVASDAKTVRQNVLISYIEPDSPAAKAGLKEGDMILGLGPVSNPEQFKLTESTQLRSATERLLKNGNTQIALKTQNQKVVQIAPRSLEEVAASNNTDNPKGYLGVLPTDYTVKRATWSAPIVAVGVATQATKATFQGLGSALANLVKGHTAEASQQVSGPVGIFFLMKQASKLGLAFMLLIIALVSLTLAIMNFLPIPALDGGRLFVTALYHGLKKRLTPKAEERIHGTGFALLMVLFVLITVVDVKRFF